MGVKRKIRVGYLNKLQMSKIIGSDRDVNTPLIDQNPLKAKFHDFDSLPFLKGVFHGSNAEGHHFICNGEPILISAQEGLMDTVNKALVNVAKGRLLTIQYLGLNDNETRGLFEVIDVEMT